MTEDEARQKWCPMVRYVASYKGTPTPPLNRAAGGNDVMLNPTNCQCIASDCMMWRWVAEDNARDVSYWGYCGLAGRPND